jgi:hypothetical protein
MAIGPEPSTVRDVRSSFVAEPGATRKERVAWLRAELQKGLDSGIDPRPPSQIIEHLISKHGSLRKLP